MKSRPIVNTLFTSAGRRVELLRAFRRAYQDLQLDGRIVALDLDPLAPALQVTDHACVVPRMDDPGYLSALTQVCAREQIDLVFPLIDPDIPFLARHRAAIEATGARVVVVPDRAVEIVDDKWRTYCFMRELGLPVPRSWLPEHLAGAELSWPLFIKPRFGSAGKGAFQVRDERELAFFLTYVDRPIVQECLPGPEITHDVVSDYEGRVLAVVSRQRIEVRWGEVSKGKTVCDLDVLRQCAALANALHAIGPITVQHMQREGQPFFTEINARFGGGAPLGFAAGVRSPQWLLALAAGLPIEVPALGSYQTGLYLSRFDDAVFLTEDECVQLRRG